MTFGSKSVLLFASILLGSFLALNINQANGQAARVITAIRSSTLQTQSATTLSEKVETVPEGAEKASDEPGAEASTKKKKESPEDKLVTLLMKAKFERTPKAILDAWSYREPKDKAEKKAEGKVRSATVANSFDALTVLKFDEAPKFKPNDVIKIKVGEEDKGESKVLSVDGKKVVAQFVLPKAKAPGETKTETKTETPFIQN